MYVINRNFVKVISKEYKLYNNCRGVLVGRILMRSHSSQLGGLQKDRRSAGGEAKVPLGSAPEAELGRRPLANSGNTSPADVPGQMAGLRDRRDCGTVRPTRFSAVQNALKPPKQVPLWFNGLPRGPMELPCHWRRKAYRSGNNRRHAGRQCPDSGSDVPFPQRRPIADPSFRSSGG